MSRASSNPYFIIDKPKESSDCPNCRFAVVGKRELCHCEQGHWADIELDGVARIGTWLECGDFRTMEG